MSPGRPAEDDRARNPDSGERGSPEETAPLLEQLRDVNARLVASSMQAQTLADQAAAARVDAEAANRLKDDFLAVVSHELRTPLNAVLGWVHLLAEGLLDPVKVAHAVLVIERNAKSLARIIDDLLDVSRLIGGTLRFELTPVDLVGVIQAALDETRLAAEAKGVTVTFNCHSVPAPVAGDALRLQQVVANLLSNAVKFTPPGGKVDVRLTATGFQAEVQVADTGQGMAREFLPHLFDRFTQADSSTTRQHGGVGLGLAIAKALVERHGGRIEAASPGPGRGATFTVWIPVLGAASMAAPEPGRVGKGRASTWTRIDEVSVLLVDDDPDGRQALAMILKIAGAKVTAVGSVRTAMAAFDDLRPDVIVSDIGMPDEDGYALIRQVRSRERDQQVAGTPAIALTGYVGSEERARLQAAGFQVHLRKPADPSEVLSAVASLTRIKSI